MVEDESSPTTIPILNGGHNLPRRTHFIELVERKYDGTFKEGKTAVSTNNRKSALTTAVWTDVATKASLGYLPLH